MGTGRQVAVYLDARDTVEVGAEVSEPFAGSERVQCSELPAGRVAHTVHFGPYGRLGEAHRTVREWCAAQGHCGTGVTWELYSHWEEDWNAESKMRRTPGRQQVDSLTDDPVRSAEGATGVAQDFPHPAVVRVIRGHGAVESLRIDDRPLHTPPHMTHAALPQRMVERWPGLTNLWTGSSSYSQSKTFPHELPKPTHACVQVSSSLGAFTPPRRLHDLGGYGGQRRTAGCATAWSKQVAAMAARRSCW